MTLSAPSTPHSSSTARPRQPSTAAPAANQAYATKGPERKLRSFVLLGAWSAVIRCPWSRIVLADRVVVSFVVRFDFEVLQVFCGGRLEVVVLVYHRDINIATVGWSKDSLEPLRHVDKTVQHSS